MDWITRIRAKHGSGLDMDLSKYVYGFSDLATRVRIHGCEYRIHGFGYTYHSPIVASRRQILS